MNKAVIVLGCLTLLLAAACDPGSGHPAAPAAAQAPRPATAAPRPAAATAVTGPSPSAAVAQATPVTTAAQAASSAAGQPAAQPQARAWWHPSDSGPNQGPEFQWELAHPLKTRNAADMGAGRLNAAGRVAGHPRLYDIDGIENSASMVKALHRLGAHVICYIEVGSAGNYYPAADEGLRTTYYAQLKAAGDLGAKMSGYPEYYLNINAASTVSIIESMIRKQCAAKGFDGVEPDIDDSYTDHTGYKITEAQNEKFDQRLGAYAHRLGLAWGQKNGDNDRAFSSALQPGTDFLLTEECNFYKSCGIVTRPYVRAGKLVLDAEYTDDWGANVATDLGRFCAADVSGRIDGTLFTSSLAGPRNPCQ
jgi:hypothetical protein